MCGVWGTLNPTQASVLHYCRGCVMFECISEESKEKKSCLTDLRDDLEKQMSELRVHFYSLLID